MMGVDLKATAEQFIERMSDELLALPRNDENDGARSDEWEFLDRPAVLRWLIAFGQVAVNAERQRLRKAALKVARPWIDGGVTFQDWCAAVDLLISETEELE